MLEIRNPATEAVIATVQTDTPESVHRKVVAARTAQRAWARQPLAERKAVLARFGELMSASEQELAATLTSEVGKPLGQALNELRGTLGRLEFFLGNVDAAVQPEVVLTTDGLEERITHEPLGVIVNISAWNYPWFVGSNVFIPALLAGNAVLYKPSEFATLTGQAMARLLAEAGLPDGLFGLVIGTGEVGAALLSERIDGVFFTGSYATGRRINEQVSSHLVKVQLELGGKDPVYIADDVDPKATAEAVADGAFYNTGQSCCAVERIYVHADVYDAFVAAFEETVRGFVVGDPTVAGTYIGPLTRKPQLDVLEDQVADAVAQGARLVTGGKRREGTGYYFEPTVLVDVNHDMKVMRDESFGPIIGIQKVGDDGEAIAMMNDTEYGLTASVYTTGRERAERILAEIQAGTAYWNCCDRVSPRLPWSGRGHSGIGLTLSHYGITTFLQPKAYHLRG